MKATALFALLATMVAAAPQPLRPRTAHGPIHIGLTKTDPADTAGRIHTAHLKTLAKYQKHLTPEGRDFVDEQLKKRDLGSLEERSSSVALTDWQGDMFYSVPVSIGTPPQTVHVQIDTGSDVLWTFSSSCTGTCGLAGFNSASSSTFTNTGTAFEVDYAVGQVDGSYATDKVDLGGITETATFGYATSAQNMTGFEGTSDGLIGFSFPVSGSGDPTPYWITQVQAGAWADNQFGLYLKRDLTAATTSTHNVPGGTLTIAGTDTSAYAGSLNYLNWKSISGMSFAWTVPFTSVKVKGVSGGSGTAIIDSGTSLLYGPQTKIATLAKAAGATSNGDGTYTISCSASNLGTKFTFGGVTYPIADYDQILSNGDGTCIWGLGYLPGVNLGGAWLLGDVWMKNVYTAFRYSPRQVGFGVLA